MLSKKAALIVFTILVLLIGVLIGIYLIPQQKPKTSEHYNPPAEEGAMLEKKGFSIYIPKGWVENTQPPMGVSAMVINVDEEITDEAAKRVNFKTYYSVIFDKLPEHSDFTTYIQAVKNSLAQNLAAEFVSEKEETINNQHTYLLEANFTQKDIDFKSLIVIVKGKGSDVWVLSFNGLSSLWETNKDTFYKVVQSFKLN